MGHGPGHVERTVRKVVNHRYPSSVRELCQKTFGLGWKDKPSKAHRVSVLRALHRIMQREPGWELNKSRSGEYYVRASKPPPKPPPPKPASVNIPIWAYRCDRPSGPVWAEATIIRVSTMRVTILFEGERIVADRSLNRIYGSQDSFAMNTWRGWHFIEDRTPEDEARARRSWEMNRNFRRARRSAAEPDEIALELLDLTSGYTKADVIRAYRARSLKLHPDQGGDDVTFRALTKARDLLLNAL